MAKELTEAQAYKQLEELFGEDNVFMDMNDIPMVEVIKTPSPSLDRALGVGGWPRGRLIQLAGKESSGKTLLALLTMAHWQSLDPENCVAFLDAEYTYDPSWTEKLGVDNDRVFLVKTNEATKLFQGLVGRVKVNKQTGKETKIKGLFDMIADGDVVKRKSPKTGKEVSLNLGKLGVICLDSVAAMNTPTEITSEVGKQNMALLARFLSVELKKLTPGIAMSNVVMFGINQVRVDPGKMFGNPEGTPGGKALKHACSLMVELGPMSGADNVLKDHNDERLGHKVRARIGKNKVAPPFKTAEYFIKYTEGVINKDAELLDTGVLAGAIERPNNRTYVIGEEKLTSKDQAIEYISQNYDEVEALVRNAYLDGFVPTPNSELEEETLEDPFDQED